MQVLIRCDQPQLLAARVFADAQCVQVRLHPDGRGIYLRIGNLDHFYTTFNQAAVEGLVRIDSVAPADADADAIYQYLIGPEGGAA